MRLSQSVMSNSLANMFCIACGLVLLAVLIILAWSALVPDVEGWHDGFAHPLSGWDHRLTMLAVGIWAARLRGAAIWLLPLTFVGVMSVGGLVGATGQSLPAVEGVILLSCIVLTLLSYRNIRFSSRVNVILVGFFGFFHGFAHGLEISASAGLLSYTLGFVLATLLLHGSGILLVKLIVFALSLAVAVIFSASAIAKTASATLDLSAKQRISSTAWNGAFGKEDASPPGAIVLSQPDDPDIGPPPIEWAIIQPHRHLQLLSYKAFKDYFPAINYTPGPALAGSGVGLTSPPSFAIGLFFTNFIFFLPSSFGSRIAYPSGFRCRGHFGNLYSVNFSLCGLSVLSMSIGKGRYKLPSRRERMSNRNLWRKTAWT